MALLLIGTIVGVLCSLFAAWLLIGIRRARSLTPQQFGEMLFDKLLEQREMNLKRCGKKCRTMLIDHVVRTSDSLERFNDRFNNSVFVQELTKAADFVSAYHNGKLEVSDLQNPYFGILRNDQNIRQSFEGRSVSTYASSSGKSLE